MKPWTDLIHIEKPAFSPASTEQPWSLGWDPALSSYRDSIIRKSVASSFPVELVTVNTSPRRQTSPPMHYFWDILPIQLPYLCQKPVQLRRSNPILRWISLG